MVEDALDFGIILNNCGVGRETSQTVISNIQNVISSFSTANLINFYVYVLHNIDDPVVLSFIIKLSDSNRDEKILYELLELLLNKDYDINNDEYINVRVLCTKAIANYKNTNTVRSLLSCLNNKKEDYKIRLACADALGRIGDKYAVESLIDVVQDENEKSIYVKESATFALGILGDSSAIDPLVAIMEAKQGLLGKFSFLKEKIVEALGRLNLNNKKVLKVLKSALLDTSPMVRINAIEALMNSEFDEATDLIHKALHDEDFEVQKNALIALYNIEGRDILDEVLSLPGYCNELKEEASLIIKEYEEE